MKQLKGSRCLLNNSQVARARPSVPSWHAVGRRHSLRRYPKALLLRMTRFLPEQDIGWSWRRQRERKSCETLLRRTELGRWAGKPGMQQPAG